MKVIARVKDPKSPSVALDCTPMWGKPYTVFAHWNGFDWMLVSGRALSKKMLDAIDRMPGFVIHRRGSK